MNKPSNIRITDVSLYFLPVRTRVPLKFGTETLTSVTCARVRMSVTDNLDRTAEGWGETPLSVQWVWPSSLPYSERHDILKRFCVLLVEKWRSFHHSGHPIEIGHAFIQKILPELLHDVNAELPKDAEPMPWLAALVCCSAFDIALHDAYGQNLKLPVYVSYGPKYMNQDLSAFLQPAINTQISFTDRYPVDFLAPSRPEKLLAWHLVGGLDPLTKDDLTGSEPDDGYPVLLADWIQRDGLKCLKIKLRGTDKAWDYKRLVFVGQIAYAHGVLWLTSDFNCTVKHVDYVNDILDRLKTEHPRLYGMLLYVEQPFPYELEQHRIDVHSLSARKPLFMDESAHDWTQVRVGRSLGWNGVALKTCKTQTGALLSLCWAKAHGMALMVQDLTNPMLAQIPHVLLAAHAGTIMGVETNAMQFYPEASGAEAKVHPGIYQRRQGSIFLNTLQGPGFGYQIEAINRQLPEPAA